MSMKEKPYQNDRKNFGLVEIFNILDEEQTAKGIQNTPVSCSRIRISICVDKIRMFNVKIRNSDVQIRTRKRNHAQRLQRENRNPAQWSAFQNNVQYEFFEFFYFKFGFLGQF